MEADRRFPRQYALPLQRVAEWEKSSSSVSSGKSGAAVFACGDFMETSSIQGALASGRRAASAVSGVLKRSY